MKRKCKSCKKEIEVTKKNHTQIFGNAHLSKQIFSIEGVLYNNQWICNDCWEEILKRVNFDVKSY